MKPFSAEEHFTFCHRLGIPLPDLKQDWEQFTASEQSEILLYWETVRGKIPDRIFELERDIISLQRQSDTEENFETVCALTWQISEKASQIHDLNLYFRLNQDVAVKAHH